MLFMIRYQLIDRKVSCRNIWYLSGGKDIVIGAVMSNACVIMKTPNSTLSDFDVQSKGLVAAFLSSCGQFDSFLLSIICL